MKKLFIIILTMYVCIVANAQSVNMSKLSNKERTEYLVNKAKEVVLAISPQYYKKCIKSIVSEPQEYTTCDSRPELTKNIGRLYYTITFMDNEPKEQQLQGRAAEVLIWGDDGSAMAYFIGEDEMGRNFFFDSFEQMKKEGAIKKSYFIPEKSE